MLSSIGRWASKALSGRQPWTLKTFANPHFERIGANQLLEEENMPEFSTVGYYPMRIGDLLASRYQVVGKLGFGATSTVWLARDLPGRRHVALKVYVRSSSLGESAFQELHAYQRLEKGPVSHPGRGAVRTLLDSFTVSGPEGEHQCLVHPPLWDSIWTFLARNPVGRLPIPVLAIVLRQVFLALDYCRECQVIHTDISPGNIMFGIGDPSVLEKFEQDELEHPTPRKETGGRIIYQSRELQIPSRFSEPVLCDLGSSVWGEEEHREDVQPDVYRSPEVILGVPWSYEIDVWNIGCAIWDMFEGGHLFDGTDPEHGVYRGRAHLAEMIALLGPPPPELVARGALSSKFFSENGQFQAGIPIPRSISLTDMETNLEGSDKRMFVEFLAKMLQWDPKNRQTPKQLLKDEWLMKHTQS
ncbi:CMGC/SRPK protein kinase [Ephemerocybe angulata]|uniref:non-specific serine/threonine protein kinase n=1 Tax=Ephemerocybe angulata TaxID=980116 RepID=A0A8H6I625_9AGAR|nr:CMGC/SRPK protein kinase [Tulosesus angulatus]